MGDLLGSVDRSILLKLSLRWLARETEVGLVLVLDYVEGEKGRSWYTMFPVGVF